MRQFSVARRDTFPVFGYDPEGTIENETFVKIEGTCGKVSFTAED